MSRRDDIITDAEEDFGLELDGNWNESILCNGDNCRHSECDCWLWFRQAVEQQLEKQESEWRATMASMKALYDGEVTAGIHRPTEAI